MKFRTLLLSGALFFSARSSFAADWVLVKHTQGCDVYVDSESVKKKNGYTECWVMNDYASPRTLPDKNEYHSSLSLWRIDQAERMIRVFSEEKYSGKKGTRELVESEYREWSNGKIMHISPGSLNEMVMNHVAEATAAPTAP